MRIPSATYRVQFNLNFRFADAENLEWRDVFAGDCLSASKSRRGKALPLAGIFSRLPFALLVGESPACERASLPRANQAQPP